MSTKSIAWITGTLTLLMALFSFILSFNALTDLATQHDVSIPYLFPLVVEAGVIIFSLNALYRSIHDEHARWQWTLILGSSLIAGIFNVLHAEPNIVSRVMAAMPSLFLLLSFESFLNQIKHSVQRANILKSIEQLEIDLQQKQLELDQLFEDKQTELDALVQAKQVELEQLNRDIDDLNQAIEQRATKLAQLKNELEQAKRVQDSTLGRAKKVKAKRDATAIEQRRSALLNILTTDSDIGVSAMADKLNASRGTVYSDLKALSEAGQISKNGNGWEVV